MVQRKRKKKKKEYEEKFIITEGYNGDNEHEAAKIDSVVEGSKDLVQALRKHVSVPADQKVPLLFIIFLLS
jgi:hypothetical protein